MAITEATVGLVPLPRRELFAVGHFDSVAGAIAATGDALELEAAAIELIDRTILDLSRSKLEYRRLSETLEGDPEALLFVTFFGDSAGRGERRSSTASRRPGAATATATTRCAPRRRPSRRRSPRCARRASGC